MKHISLLMTGAVGVVAIVLAGCAVNAEAQTGAVQAAAAPAPVAAAQSAGQAASPQRDPATLGRALFLRCAACHAVSASEPAKIGPHLEGIVGRPAAALESFSYSAAMKASGVTWDAASLDRFLARPAELVPGTSMAFGGLDSQQQRAAVIAYLETLD